MSVVGTATPTAPDHASVSRSKSKSKHKSKSKSKSISEPGSGSRSGNGGYYPSLPPFPFNFHLLEVTVISAQDLQPAGRSMQTYAVAWIDPSSKSRTRLDAIGYTDPSWNEKFVFRVEDDVLRSDTSFVSVEIYARGSVFRSDNLLGTARALISTLRPSLATQFHALQVLFLLICTSFTQSPLEKLWMKQWKPFSRLPFSQSHCLTKTSRNGIFCVLNFIFVIVQKNCKVLQTFALYFIKIFLKIE